LKGLYASAKIFPLLVLCLPFSTAAQPLSFELDRYGRLAAVEDTWGQITRYVRDPEGHLLQLTYPDGRWNEYRYDAQGRLSELRTEKGRELHYRYDPQGRWTEVRFPNGDTQRFSPTPDARGLNLTYPDGTVTAFHFDAQGRLERAETSLSSMTLRYDAKERLDSLRWADGRAVGFRYDDANRVRALADAAGKERRDWDITMQTTDAGRALTVTDALDRLEIRRDRMGRLASAASDSGWKAVLHWDTSAGQPRSMTGPWGYVELDSRGRPTEILTPQGARVTARWDIAGRLERMNVPPLGDVRLGYGAGRFPTTVDLGDGLRTALWSAGRSPIDTSRAEPLARSPIQRDTGIQLRYPMPALSAERMFSAQEDRFWSRVSSLVEASARLPLLDSRQALAHDDYWTSGKYQNDPYYLELARPAPELTPESYARSFILTVGIIAIDWNEFFQETIPFVGKIEPGFLVSLLSKVRPTLVNQLHRSDPGDDIIRNLDAAKENLHKFSDQIDLMHSIVDLKNSILDHSRMMPWVRRTEIQATRSVTLLLMTEEGTAKLTLSHTIRLKFFSQGYVISIDAIGALKDQRSQGALKRAAEYLKNLANKQDRSWNAFLVHMETETRRVLSVIDLLSPAPKGASGPTDEARSGVEILRKALDVDLAAVPVQKELEKRGKAIREECPPDQVTCKEGSHDDL